LGESKIIKDLPMRVEITNISSEYIVYKVLNFSENLQKSFQLQDKMVYSKTPKTSPFKKIQKHTKVSPIKQSGIKNYFSIK